jgi:hypothetical protein
VLAAVNVSVVSTPLSPEQHAIVDAPMGERLLVLAGAGTGKTHVLVERIKKLIDENDLAPGREVLALSFSRAAVGELKRRLRPAGNSASLVRPITFDSFATRVLASLGDAAPTNWKELGYDGRIGAAATALATESGRELLDEYKHVLVDEIQDLVGVRASMVAAILESIEGGFTLLGDPAQAIYDHQVRVATDKTTSDQFLESVRKRNPTLRTCALDKNFRGNNAESVAVERIGIRLRARKPDSEKAASALARVYRELEPLGEFDDLAYALRGARRTVAVLSRSNLDALRISRSLYEHDVDHRLQREATDRALPAWLAVLFRETDRSTWSRRRLEGLLEERGGTEIPEVETVWRLLTETVGDDEVINLDVLRRRIAIGITPDELVAPSASNVTVSTVHRSKGLEFDLVFTPPPKSDIEDERDLEELRILYVALSRAKEEMWTFPLPSAEPWQRDASIGGRLVRSSWRDRSKASGIELHPGDLDAGRPFGVGLIEDDPRSAQDYLRDYVRRGDPIEMELVHVRDTDEGPVPFYAALHAGRRVGQTSEELGRALVRRLRSGKGPAPWPPLLSGTSCDGVETVVGMASETEAAGIGSSGLWLRPRLVGLADLRWHADETNGRA